MRNSLSRGHFRRRLVIGCSGLLLLAGVGACRGTDQGADKSGDQAAKAPPTEASPGFGASPAATATERRAQPVATLTGRPGPHGPVFAIKVDNAPSARPLQRGLDAAAVVYQEVVEGGITRYLAIFVGSGDTIVGPVRSARDTDLAILAPYGRVVLGFSGANDGVLAAVRAADLLDVPYDYVRRAYWVAGRRREAFNVYTTPARLLAAAGGGAEDVRDVGLRFGPPPGGGSPVAVPVRVAFSYRSTVTLAYDARSRTWRLNQNGTPLRLANGALVSPANVVLQRVTVRSGRYVDTTGYASPDTEVVGAGPVSVYRDGRRFDGTWRRSRADAVTRFVTADGTDIPLAAGQTWVLLAPKRPIGPGGPAVRRPASATGRGG